MVSRLARTHRPQVVRVLITLSLSLSLFLSLSLSFLPSFSDSNSVCFHQGRNDTIPN